MLKALRPSWPKWLALIAIWALLPFGPATASLDHDGKRLALVVGNSAYESVYSLKNAVNDSEAVAEMLRRLGFDVTSIQNVGREEFQRALDEFSRAAEGAETTIFFFSGHGFQLNGANYLVPSDAKLASRDAIEEENLRLDDIIGRLQARNRQTLIFLDACRNNPLPESVRGDNAADGLAQIETGSGTFVAFATQPGNVTRDGAGDHSPFTTALLEHIETPGISISDMMIRVRNMVEEATLHQQTPWDQSSLRSQFYFNPQSEESEELTEEDRELLLSLDPELRKRFEIRFGLKIESVDEDEDGVEEVASAEPLIPTIQPAVSIEAIAEAETVAAEAAEEAPVTGRLQILPADEDVPAEGDLALVPIPGPRPETEEEVEVVRLEPIEGATRAPMPIEPSQVPEPAGLLPAEIASQVPNQPQAVSSVEQPVAPPPAEISAAAPASGTAERAGTSRNAEPARAVEQNEIALAAPPELSLKPGTPERARIVGQETSLEPDSGAEALALVPTRLPGASTVVRSGKKGDPATQLAALDPGELKPEPIKPAPEITESADAQAPKDLPRAIQEELARLGCYRNAIDGIWGSGSARALLRYYAIKKEAPDQLEPNMALYSRLTTEEVVVCKRTESDKPSSKKAKKQQPQKEIVREKRPAKGSASTVASKKSKSYGGGSSKTAASETKIRLKKSLKIGAFR